MQINLTARGTELTPALRDYANEKIGKLEHFSQHIEKIEIILEAHDINDAEKRQMAEIRAWVGGLKFLQAKEAARDMYAAIDLVLEEIKLQLKKHKEKHIQEKRRKSSILKHLPLESAEPEL